MKAWWPKVRVGGLFAGHDWGSPAVKDAVTTFHTVKSMKKKVTITQDGWPSFYFFKCSFAPDTSPDINGSR